MQGQTPHVPLTAQGVAEAEAARDGLRGRRLAAIWSSDLLRARQTAAIVAAGRPVAEVPALREVALGRLEGLLTAELRAEETPPGAHVSEVRWGGGESLADVAARLRPLLDDLSGHFGSADEVLLVSHADTLRVLVTLLEGKGHRDIDWDRWGTWPNGRMVSRQWPAPPANG